MKKMPCLFVREFHGKRDFTITEQVTPGCEWALAGEGVATVKWDGTACMVKHGRLYKRYDAKKNPKTGEFRIPPFGAIPCDEPDEVTGHWPHWVLVDPEKPEDKWHAEAWAAARWASMPSDGTYELIGPAINGNPYRFGKGWPHTLIKHARPGDVCNPPLGFEGLRSYLALTAIEGLVFHHASGDGRMTKIRRADFGLKWPVNLEAEK